MITDLLSEPSAGFCGFREMLLNQCVGPWQGHGETQWPVLLRNEGKCIWSRVLLGRRDEAVVGFYVPLVVSCSRFTI